jgi:hypothetical protein
MSGILILHMKKLKLTIFLKRLSTPRRPAIGSYHEYVSQVNATPGSHRRAAVMEAQPTATIPSTDAANDHDA